MNRATILYGDGSFLCVEAEEMHEDGDYLKVYKAHSELSAMIKTSLVNVAYITEAKKNG